MIGALPIAALPSWSAELIAAASGVGEDARAGLELAVRFGHSVDHPGHGRTAQRWAVLAAVAAENLSVARILEAHTDALAILAEHADAPPDGGWGVFAAEGGPGLRAESRDGAWFLTGVKQWCSLGGLLDHALVTAWSGAHRRLFAVDLRLDSVRAAPAENWIARGLTGISSAPVSFDSTPARPIGDPGWYLARPGFAWGGLGVAACWFGGAWALGASLAAAAGRHVSDDIWAMHLGAVDVVLHAGSASLRDAAARIDDGVVSGRDAEVLALRVRSVVADAAEDTLRHVGHALGPFPLAFDEAHARRVADLTLYLRQHHGEKDLCALGHLLGDAR